MCGLLGALVSLSFSPALALSGWSGVLPLPLAAVHRSRLAVGLVAENRVFAGGACLFPLRLPSSVGLVVTWAVISEEAPLLIQRTTVAGRGAFLPLQMFTKTDGRRTE